MEPHETDDSAVAAAAALRVSGLQFPRLCTGAPSQESPQLWILHISLCFFLFLNNWLWYGMSLSFMAFRKLFEYSVNPDDDSGHSALVACG